MVRSGDVGRVLLLSKLGRLAGCVEHPDIEIVLELELSWSGGAILHHQTPPRRPGSFSRGDVTGWNLPASWVTFCPLKPSQN